MIRRSPTSYYVHVPFCQARCRYCDFHSRVSSAEAMTEYLGALEIDLARLPGRPRAKTLYVGGGTPTALAPPLIERLVGILDARFGLERSEEITFEVNPGTLTPRTTEILRRAGVSRLSFGVQTFQDPLLRLLGRLHDAATAQGAIQAARAAGFANLSLDLIYGIPGSTVDTWRDDIQQAIALEPEHLSVYGLPIEAGTVFDAWATEGRITPLEGDAMADLFELTVELLRGAGYEQYEISNFARPGHECRHNVAIWRNRSYVGFGPSAASYVDGVRSRNICSTVEYARRVRAGESPVEESEELPPERALGEAMMLSLRMNDGVTASEVRRRYGVDPLDRYREPLARFAEAGLVTLRRNRIRLTDRGRLLADEVFQALL